ncbi:MAG: glycoside hydrolase family 36 protein [Bacteroidales bacterium]
MNHHFNLLKGFAVVLGLATSLSSCTKKNDTPIEVQIVSKKGAIKHLVTESYNERGEKSISISLINKSNTTDSIVSIKVLLNPELVIDQNTKTMLGGSCMGRTPLQISEVSDTTSQSGTFLMLKNHDNYSLVGTLTWNTFLPYFHMSGDAQIAIEAVGENKPIQPGESITFEKIVVTNGDNWQDLMFEYGKLIGDEHKIKPKKPIEMKGWATWDYFGRVYDKKDIQKNVEQLLKHNPDANLIQIDGGWWTSRGDYLSVRENLDGGMKGVADYIKSKGLMAGIHLDGFRADKTSELYKQHPDWFLKDQDGETIYQPIDKGDTFMQYIYFDFSNPEVCDYMKNVLSTIRTDWGYDYFKIDFMRYGLYETIMDLHGPNEKPFEDAAEGVASPTATHEPMKVITEIKSFDNSMTSVERTRAGLKAMREGIGEKFFLGCSSIFGPTLGLVDGLRTGGDISPRYEYYKTRVLQNAGNFYLNTTVTQADADYIVLRNKLDEETERAWGKHKFGGNTTFDQVKMWNDYTALQGGIKLSSDNLPTLRKERQDLIKKNFSYKTATRFIPLDIWEHAKTKNDAFNIMLAENEDGIYLSLFNWDKAPKKYTFEGLQNTIIYNDSMQKIDIPGGLLEQTLNGQSSIILKLEKGSFDELRQKLKWQITESNTNI